MNLKKTVATAKKKIKEYAPEILTIGTVVAAVTYSLYYISKLNDELDEIPVFIPIADIALNDPESMEKNDTVTLLTGDDREEIVNDQNLNLYRVDGLDDFYFLSTPE